MSVAIRARSVLGRAAAHTRGWGLGLASRGTPIATSSSTTTITSATTSGATTSDPSKQKPTTKKPTTTAYFVGGLPPDSTEHCRFVECEKARPSWTVERLVREALPRLGLLDADGKTLLLSRDSLVFHVSAELATSPNTNTEQLSSGGKQVDLFTQLFDLRSKTKRKRSTQDNDFASIYFYIKAKPTGPPTTTAAKVDASSSLMMGGEIEATANVALLPRPAKTLSPTPIATKVTVQELEGGNGATVLSLPKGVKWPFQNFNRLFKRDFYDRFITDFLLNFYNPKGRRGVLVMGSEGIGKSSFALYCLWKALQMGKTVVYQHHGIPFEFKVFTPGSPTVHVYKEPNAPRELDDPNAVYIVDGMTPLGAEAFTLLVSSPNHDRVNTWSKGHRRYFLPTWSFEEVQLMRTHCYDGRSYKSVGNDVLLSDDELQRRFSQTGGAVRSIFVEEEWEEFPELLKDCGTRAVELVKTMRKNVYHTCHHSIHLDVNPNTFEVDGLMFASEGAADVVYNEMLKDGKDVVDTFMINTKSRPELASFRGRIFERRVCTELSKVGDSPCWTARPLDSLAASHGTSLPVPIPMKPPTVFNRIEDMAPGDFDEPLLWCPKSRNPTAADLLITVGEVVYFLQCTVSNTHDINLRTAVEHDPGLLQQADILAKNGFNTAGAVNFVHITEKSMEPELKIGTLNITGKQDQQPTEAAPGSSSTSSGAVTVLDAASSKEGKAQVPQQDRDRVVQWVVGAIY